MLRLIVLTALVFVAACGKDKSPLAPSGPTPGGEPTATAILIMHPIPSCTIPTASATTMSLAGGLGLDPAFIHVPLRTPRTSRTSLA